MKQPELVTKRLLLRGFDLDDAPAVQSLAANYNVSRTTLNIPYPYEPGMAEDWINSHQHGWETKSTITYAITLKTSGQLVGAISLMNTNAMQTDLGYWIGEPYWGMGYCTEAVTKLIPFAFNELGLDKVVAEHLAANPASGRVMQKAGMQKTQTTHKQDRNQQQACMIIYEIRRD